MVEFFGTKIWENVICVIVFEMRLHVFVISANKFDKSAFVIVIVYIRILSCNAVVGYGFRYDLLVSVIGVFCYDRVGRIVLEYG